MNVKLVRIDKKVVAVYGSNGREKLKQATRRSVKMANIYTEIQIGCLLNASLSIMLHCPT
jgi:hypothetical protein